MKLLVMGLAGSGKTTLSRDLAEILKLPHHNADTIRERFDDWDFSYEGRKRQAERMSTYHGVLDFICPLPEFRDIVDPDLTIWMDTIKSSRYYDTDKIFTPPNYDIRITQWIDSNQLHRYLEDFNHGIVDIPNYLRKRMSKLDK